MNISEKYSDNTINQAGLLLHNFISEIAKFYFGPLKIIKLTVAAFLSENHVLLEDVPGVGKTTLAKTLAAVSGTTISRVQCTPDLMPSDVLGFSLPLGLSGDFTFKKGPVFSNIVIVDEINRASPRTQSAFLEAMEEHKVTIEGTTYSLPSPFFVIATQNPIEIAGTYPLPVSQLDRFGLKLKSGYPINEKALLKRKIFNREQPKQIFSKEKFSEIVQLIDLVNIEDSLIDYIYNIGVKSRKETYLQFGLSPRALISWIKISKVLALIAKRNFVIPEDIHETATAVLSHRIHIKPEHRGLVATSGKEVIEQFLNSTPLPL